MENNRSGDIILCILFDKIDSWLFDMSWDFVRDTSPKKIILFIKLYGYACSDNNISVLVLFILRSYR